MAAGRVYIALLHYPVLDKDGRVITSAVTNLDLHDLARLCATFSLGGYFVIQPLELQKKLVRRLISYWREGYGGEYNWTRKEAFERTRLVDTLAEAIKAIEEECGSRPVVIGTSAKSGPDRVKFPGLRREMEAGGVWLIVIGTGWGVEPGFLAEKSDRVLEPVAGRGAYNHLPVRAAAAIILDRLLGVY